MHYKIIAIDPDFTFHSGYILMDRTNAIREENKILYIPIWSYSNANRGCGIVTKIPNFTFQSGYIQIWMSAYTL